MSQLRGGENSNLNRDSGRNTGGNAPQRPDRRAERPLSEREIREMRARKARKMKLMRRRRRILLLGLLAVCVLTGVLVAAVSGRVRSWKAEKAAVQAAAMQESMSASAAEAESLAAAEAEQYRANLPDMGAIYGIAVNGVGWSHFFADNSYSMAPANSYITALRATLNGQPEGMSGTIRYRVNLSGTGWLDWQENGNEAGDSAGSMPLEGIAMELTGDLATYYEVLYSVLQDSQWTEWASDGAEAGAVGVGLHVDGVRISVVKRTGGEAYAGNIDPNRPMVALTYDDGPSPTVTPRILKCLQDNGGRATFFMVGKQVIKSPDVLKKMVAQGCEGANHTFDHKDLATLDTTAIQNEVSSTNDKLNALVGHGASLVRPPYGSYNSTVKSVIGFPMILWSIDTLDWKTKNAQSTYEAAMTAQDGDVILMHDIHGPTADAVDMIVPALKAKGFQMVTVSELAAAKGINLENGGAYGALR